MPPVSLQDFFSAPEIQLPMSWAEEDDFEVFIQSRFSRYIELVHNLASSPVRDIVAPRENAIQSCCDGLRAAIRSTFEGHPSDAYETFSNAISEIRTELER